MPPAGVAAARNTRNATPNSPRMFSFLAICQPFLYWQAFVSKYRQAVDLLQFLPTSYLLISQEAAKIAPLIKYANQNLMRSLLTLTLAFALLVTYMETMVPETQAAMTAPISAKVVRTEDSNTSATTVAAAKPAKPQPILNLNLPSFGDIEQSFSTQIQDSPALDIFSKVAKQDAEKTAITYNAELVFDAEKGEEITGGKIHIKIPLS